MNPARYLLTALLMGSLLTVAACAHAADEGPWRVLLIYSYGRNFQPHSTVATEFRTQLVRRAARPIEFNEVTVDMDTELLAETAARDDTSLAQYLLARFAQEPPDLIVTIGRPAASFFTAHRSALFPSTPLLIAGVESHMLEGLPLGPLDVASAARYDTMGMVNTLLALRPRTRHIMVVYGASAPERRWTKLLQEEFRSFGKRVTFTWTHDLSLDEILAQAAALGPDTAILYGRLQVDAAGIPHEGDAALDRLHEVASVPIFGFSDNQLGHGIVGGPLLPLREVGRDGAETALFLLGGARPSAAARHEVTADVQQFDWRELKRWGISEFSLPPDSVIRFRAPTLWEQHAVLIVSGLLIILFQAALITALMVQYRRRNLAEREARDLNKRLLSATEDEKRRLARELHDDFSHRLARLSLDASLLDDALPPGGDAPRVMQGMREEISRLAEDMHAIAHQLHPAILEDLGLAEALRTEGDLLARTNELDVTVKVDDVPRQLPPDVALCAFRICQEALQNVSRHAQASAVGITLRTVNGQLCLTVRDNGVGFDPERDRIRASLGHASMRERVRLVGGEVNIHSHPGLGTTIETQIPLAETAA
jgi:signal transduction histidine kinase